MEHRPLIHNLASGSSANSLLVRHAGLTGLIDCGLPIRKLRAALTRLGAQPETIDFVFVTHEHSDHIRSLPQLQRLGSTIVTSRGTARALGLAPRQYVAATAWKTQSLAGIELTPLPVSHDSAEPQGVMLTLGSLRITAMTDLGRVTPQLTESLTAADIIVIEANHDVDMLRLGPYPPHLKRRVLSDHGHLSNADCGHALRSALIHGSKAPSVWLAHLSETNNRPVTASSTVKQYIPGVQVATLPRHDVVDLMAAPDPSRVVELTVQALLWVDR